MHFYFEDRTEYFFRICAHLNTKLSELFRGCLEVGPSMVILSCTNFKMIQNEYPSVQRVSAAHVTFVFLTAEGCIFIQFYVAQVDPLLP